MSDEQKKDSDIVTFVPGSSIIDIGSLRRAQLDDEATLILEEFENDPEMKKDVLDGFDGEESNSDLEKMAEAVQLQTDQDLQTLETLSLESSQELKDLNDDLIAEDKVLEKEIAEDQIETEEMSEADASLMAALPKPDENGIYDLDDLQSCLDTLLFYSDRPISIKKIKTMLEMEAVDDSILMEALDLLKASYRAQNHGFEIADIAGGYQLRTKPEKAALLRKLAKVQVQRLSRGAMETLTICAYKQPCTKDDIDQVRGVDSSHFIRTLLDRKLIEISGRSETPGRPMIYTTTDTFLEVFGLMDLSGLPPLREIEAMVPQLAASEEGGEDPRVLQMRKLVGQMKTEANHLDYNAREDEVILQEIRDRVKSIDISTPYLERQKQLAEQGIQGDEAEAILAKEFGFERSLVSEPKSEQPDQLSLEELSEIATRNASLIAEQELTSE